MAVNVVELDSDTDVMLWEQSFCVRYKGITSGVIYIRAKPEEQDYMAVVRAMRDAFKHGENSVKKKLSELFPII
jgi:hypothetical protein